MATNGNLHFVAAAILSLALGGMQTQTGRSWMVEGMAHVRWELGRRLSSDDTDLARSMTSEPLEGAPSRRLAVDLPWNSFGHGSTIEDLERKEPAGGAFGGSGFGGGSFGDEVDYTDFDQQLLKVGKTGAVAPAIMRESEEPGGTSAAWR